jgi:hypothetical protein
MSSTSSKKVEPKDSEVFEKEKEDREKEIEEKTKMLSNLKNINVQEGDYQIQVHIIEVRDLTAKNLDGTSDPIVFMETFGQKQHTTTVYGVASCVFDELNIFNIKDVDKETFEEELITVSVYDSSSNPFAKQVLIGKKINKNIYVYISIFNYIN